MYAVIFDRDANCLNEQHNINPSNNVYKSIRNFMEENGFIWQQGGLYFGSHDRINSVSCCIAVQKLAKQYDWFNSCVKSIRMLRIEENSDLMPAINI